jgi:hypothetical protein
MSTEPASVDLFDFLAERMIRKIEEEPITVTVHLSDGSIEIPIGPKHRWFKELNRRRAEQIRALRATLSQNPNQKKESDVLVDRATPDSVSQNENTNSRTAN